MVSHVASVTQSLPIGGVEDERKQLLHFPFVVSLRGRSATALASAVGICQDGDSPILHPLIGVNEAGEVFDVPALPVGVSVSQQVLAHPLSLTGMRAERVLLSCPDRRGGAPKLGAALSTVENRLGSHTSKSLATGATTGLLEPPTGVMAGLSAERLGAEEAGSLKRLVDVGQRVVPPPTLYHEIRSVMQWQT